jgi:hypothetical protein
MAWIIETESDEYPTTPTGVYPGVVSTIADLGHRDYKGDQNFVPQFFIEFDLQNNVTGERTKHGEFFTLSTGPKSRLGPLVNGLGAVVYPFNITSYLGRKCMVQIVDYTKQDGTKTTRIGALIPGDGIELEGPPLTEADSLLLPDRMQEMIKEGMANRARLFPPKPATPAAAPVNDEIPF